MAHTIDRAPILALVSPEMRSILEQRLVSIDVQLVFVQNVADLLAAIRQAKTFSVVILPASLPDGDVWTVWGELALSTLRPEFVIYAPSASFELWSGVLEAGGHDVMVAPFHAEDVQKTVLSARRAFERKHQQHVEHELSK